MDVSLINVSSEILLKFFIEITDTRYLLIFINSIHMVNRSLSIFLITMIHKVVVNYDVS